MGGLIDSYKRESIHLSLASFTRRLKISNKDSIEKNWSSTLVSETERGTRMKLTIYNDFILVRPKELWSSQFQELPLFMEFMVILK